MGVDVGFDDKQKYVVPFCWKVLKPIILIGLILATITFKVIRAEVMLTTLVFGWGCNYLYFGGDVGLIGKVQFILFQGFNPCMYGEVEATVGALHPLGHEVTVSKPSLPNPAVPQVG